MERVHRGDGRENTRSPLNRELLGSEREGNGQKNCKSESNLAVFSCPEPALPGFRQPWGCGMGEF
jgi:hypothetical protein